MLITHINLDWDAITGCWLLQRYGGFDKEDVKFVNTGNPDRKLLAQAKAVVDTGKVYDPEDFRFDHHQLPGNRANEASAALQVFVELQTMQLDVDYLFPLVSLVFAGDTGRPEANHSRELGLHALLSAYKAAYKEKHGIFAPDDVILAWGYQMLDLLDLRLRKQAEARAELAEKVVYKSDDGLVWAIRHGSTSSSFAAFEKGARLVVFEGEPIEDGQGNVLSYPIGIQRAGEWTEPHVGELVNSLLANSSVPHHIANEVRVWYNHNAGFFSGKGTAKAPYSEPPLCELEELAKWIDKIWNR